MKFTKKNRFTNFRKNKFFFANHINELLKDVKKKVIYKSYLTASVIVTNENRKDVPTFFNWSIKKVGKKVIILEGKKIINEFEFKNNLLYLLRKSNTILLSLNNLTNQKYTDQKKEIVELWGFKATLFFNIVVIEKISSEELFNICTELVDGQRTIEPEPHVIYCGPDGKIFGWDLV
jgi:hypothetical protein